MKYIIITILLSIFVGYSILAQTTMTASVEDNTVKYLQELVIERESWVEQYFVEDSKCWVHWVSCNDIKYCVRDAVFCMPE